MCVWMSTCIFVFVRTNFFVCGGIPQLHICNPTYCIGCSGSAQVCMGVGTCLYRLTRAAPCHPPPAHSVSRSLSHSHSYAALPLSLPKQQQQQRRQWEFSCECACVCVYASLGKVSSGADECSYCFPSSCSQRVKNRLSCRENKRKRFPSYFLFLFFAMPANLT